MNILDDEGPLRPLFIEIRQLPYDWILPDGGRALLYGILPHPEVALPDGALEIVRGGSGRVEVHVPTSLLNLAAHEFRQAPAVWALIQDVVAWARTRIAASPDASERAEALNLACAAMGRGLKTTVFALPINFGSREHVSIRFQPIMPGGGWPDGARIYLVGMTS